MLNNMRMREGFRLRIVGLASIMALCAANGGSAMPVETGGSYDDIPGATADGQLDIREVLDNSTEMDIRLTKQIMLLQRQINQLQRKIERLEAARDE